MATLNNDYGALVKALNDAVKNSVILEPKKVECYPTGSILLDLSIGTHGVPLCRMSEIFGGESAGKSTVSMELCVAAQFKGTIPTYIDTEHSFDPAYATGIGVDLSRFVLVQPDNAEDAFRLAEAAIANGSGLVIIDSIGAMVVERETEDQSDIGDNSIGILPKIISKFVHRAQSSLTKYNSSILFVNQLRAKIGLSMPGSATTDTPGGYALKHASSVRIKAVRSGKESGDDPSYIEGKYTIIKNKIAPPYQTANIKIRFGKGFDLWSEIVTIAIDNKIIKKAGSWYKHNDVTIGQGETAVIDHLKSNKELIKIILETVDVDREFYLYRIEQK